MSRQRLLCEKIQKAGFKPHHVAEIGVFLPEDSNIYDFIIAGVKSTLVEPDPRSARANKEHFHGRDNVTLHTVAVYHTEGKVQLAQRQASTYVTDLTSSPAIVNDGYHLDEKDTFTVDAVTFDTIDDGTIDVLGIDVEGCEWFVLEKMKSRPTVLSIETHGAMYINPHIKEIDAWLQSNVYTPWYRTESDTVYVRGSAIRVDARDRARLVLDGIALTWLRWKLRLKSLRQS